MEKVNWLELSSLLSFFGNQPSTDEELRQVFQCNSGDIRLVFEICQADRFIALELYERKSENRLVELVLPNYDWLCLTEDQIGPLLLVGPPRSYERISAGGGVTVCPVVLRVTPFLSIAFDRKNDRVAFSIPIQAKS